MNFSQFAEDLLMRSLKSRFHIDRIAFRDVTRTKDERTLSFWLSQKPIAQSTKPWPPLVFISID